MRCEGCGEEYSTKELYEYEDTALCAECILNKYKTIADIEGEETDERYRISES